MLVTTISTPESLKEFETSVEKSINTPEVPNRETQLESEKSSNLETSNKETEQEKEKSSKIDFNRAKTSITGALDTYGMLISKSSEESKLPEERKKLDEVLGNIKLISKAVGSILSVTEPLMPDTLKVISKVIRLAIAGFDEVNSSRIETVKELGKNIAEGVKSLATGPFSEKLNTITGVISTIGGVMDGMNKLKEKEEIEKSKSEKQMTGNDKFAVNQEVQRLVESMQGKTTVSSSKISSPATPSAPKMEKGAVL